MARDQPQEQALNLVRQLHSLPWAFLPSTLAFDLCLGIPGHTGCSRLRLAEWYNWGLHRGNDLGARAKRKGVKYMAPGPGCLLRTPNSPHPAAFLLFCGGEQRPGACLCAEAGEAEGLSSNPNILADKPQAPWSPAAHPSLGGDEPQLHRRAPTCPISPHPALEARLTRHLPGQSDTSSEPTGAHGSLSEHLPLYSQMECSGGTGSVLLI